MKPIEGKKAPYCYDGTEYDSKEEIYFVWWLDELALGGYIQRYANQPRTYILAEKYTYEVITQLKTKTRSDIKTLLQPHTYTPDVKIFWKSRADGVFHRSILSRRNLDLAFVSMLGVSLVDVKPAFDMNDATRRFHVSQKWVMQRHGVYVQKVITVPKVSKSGVVTPKSALFETTFAPERFRITDGGKIKRKGVDRYRTLDEFIGTQTGGTGS